MKAALPATASAVAVLAAGMLILLFYDLGPQSAHMAAHIALMNVAAPLAAIRLAGRLPPLVRPATMLWAATVTQIALLWIWHAPSLQQAAMHAPALQGFMHATLLLAALAFWCVLISLPPVSRWQGIAALLLTGKLACLLSALMIFAPRLLHGAPHGATLEDQQLAGLLMITACPLSYIVAAVVVAAQIVTAPAVARTAPAAR